MKQKNHNWRKTHVGKSTGEKEAYARFLQSEFALGKTEEPPENLDKTNTSSFELDERPVSPAPTEKSWFLKLKDLDFLKIDWVKQIIIAVLSGIILLLLTGYFTLWSDLKAQQKNIENLEDDIVQLTSKYETTSDKINELDKENSVSRAEILKDLQYIKERLEAVSR